MNDTGGWPMSMLSFSGCYNNALVGLGQVVLFKNRDILIEPNPQSLHTTTEAGYRTSTT